jgi:hypothetical protein
VVTVDLIDLDAIRERQARVDEAPQDRYLVALGSSVSDVLPLVAEVARLRAENARLTALAGGAS